MVEILERILVKLVIRIRMKDIRLRDHSPEELVFYSKGTTDIEFASPFGVNYGYRRQNRL